MIFMKNHDFGEISWTANLAHEINFRRVFDLKIPWGPCAARNVQNFGVAHVVLARCCFHVFYGVHISLNHGIWLVETVYPRQPSNAILLLPSRANLRKSWQGTMLANISGKSRLFRIQPSDLSFLLSSPSKDHADSDSERESFQKIHWTKFERR